MPEQRVAASLPVPAGPFEPGRNCWRLEHADRAAFLVDGDAYFKAFVAAAEKAQRSILIVGWDFHSRTRLLCADAKGAAKQDCELELGEFLNRLVKRNRQLQVHVLIWDYPMIFGVDREWAPIYGLGWKPRRRVHFRYDNTHPVGGSHHQKIVVIDDVVAFNGGIDLTSRRWDTCAHAADDALRVANGASYPPFHDLMMLVEGNAAAALGDLVRDRWCRATGETLSPAAIRRSHWPMRRRRKSVAIEGSAWPDPVHADVRNVQVAISRTQPPSNGNAGVREVEALFIDMIAAARNSIYMENQYFTADAVGSALERRLKEPDGPEIVVVVRRLSHGWLEELAMESRRAALIRKLRAADKFDRLRILYPHIEGLQKGTCIDVHAKLLIVDDEFARIGSANIANRSMGMDTECDLTIHSGGRADVSDAVRALRSKLLAEHLGTTPAEVQAAIVGKGSLCGGIAQLQTTNRSLHELTELPEVSEAVMGLASVADPERPVQVADLMKIFSSSDVTSQKHGPAWRGIAVVVAVIAGLAVLWKFTPLADLVNARQVAQWAREAGNEWWAPLAAIAAYTPAAATMFPRPLITLFCVVAFGPWFGFLYAMLGIELSAWATFIAGTHMQRDTIRRIAGTRLNDVVQVLRRRGLIAMTALRLVPLAPFAVEGIVAGAVGVKLWQFMLGTAIGILPGTLAATVFGDQMQAALDDPSRTNYWLIGGAVAVMVAATLLVRRWLLNSAASMRPQTSPAPRAVGSARVA